MDTDRKIIDFMKFRKFFVWISVALLVIAAAELFFMTGINFGIDFKGGTQLTVKFKETVDMEEIRRMLEEAGQRDAQLQRFGSDSESPEVLIKTPVVEGSEEGSSGTVIAALDAAFNDGSGSFDLNQRGKDALASLLLDADPDAMLADNDLAAREHYAAVSEAVISARQMDGLFTDFSALGSVTGLSPAASEVLQEKAFLGGFTILQNDNVGPQIGAELRQKGVLAVLLSLIGMLGYITMRFELRYGVGALVAVFHDFLITLGLFALLNYEFNLATIAAFLTLVGYSVNDTVVIFDRVRENRQRSRRMPLVDVINESLTQTLSRTIMTSLTTLLVVACLFFLGGEAIRGFAFVLLIGVMIGTYSSIFVASPFALVWDQYFAKEKG